MTRPAKPDPGVGARLTGVAWRTVRVPFRAPYETARGSARERAVVIVRLSTDAGVSGLGEASLDPAEPPAAIEGVVERLAALAGRLLSDGPRVLDEATDGSAEALAARCALETALLDARARQGGIAVAQLLAADYGPGGAGHPRLRALVNATVAARPAEEAAAAARAARARGFTCVKLKVGMEKMVAAEVERVRRIREVIGPGMSLRLDANGAWDVTRAIETLRALTGCGIELIEQPVAAEDVEGLRQVSGAVDVTVAADEALDDPSRVPAVLGACDAVVLKPARLGGPAAAAATARRAREMGRGVIVTTTIDCGPGTAASLHLAAALGSPGLAHGLATAGLLQSDLLTAPLMVERGYLTLPQRAGLGVELDGAALERYATGAWELRP